MYFRSVLDWQQHIICWTSLSLFEVDVGIVIIIFAIIILSCNISTSSSYCRHIPHGWVTASSQGLGGCFHLTCRRLSLSILAVPEKTDFCTIPTLSVIPSMSIHLLKLFLTHPKAPTTAGTTSNFFSDQSFFSSLLKFWYHYYYYY